MNNNKERRPNVSMVKKAGQAKIKLTAPKPNENNRESTTEPPAEAKMVLE